MTLIALIGSLAYFYNSIQSQLNINSLELKNAEEFNKDSGSNNASPIWEGYKGEFTMLLIGSDERDGTTSDSASGKLSDVLLLIHVVEDQSRASIVSIPRDLMVEFPKCNGTQPALRQINSALSIGGVDCVVKVVESMSGLKIPHAILVNFSSVVNITNIIGGVPICMPEALYQHGTKNVIAPEGDSILKGENALSFLRERKTVRDGGDLGRMANQQIFMKNMLTKLTKDGTLRNPVTMFDLASQIVKEVRVSSTLTDIKKLVSLGLMVRSIDSSNIDFYSMPVKTYELDPNRLSIKESEWRNLLLEIKSYKKDISLPPVEIEGGYPIRIPLPSETSPDDYSIKNEQGYYCGTGSN